MKKDVVLDCPRCGKKHVCPRVWFMYRHDDWIGHICMFYCHNDPMPIPIYKLYTEEFRYIAWTTGMTRAMSWNDSNEVPF